VKSHGGRLVLLGLLIPLAVGRWGSYMGLPETSIFVSDVLVLIGIAMSLSTGVGWNATPKPIWPILLIVPLQGWLVARGADLHYKLRDTAPFLYFALTPWISTALSRVPLDTIRRWVGRSLLIHLAWFSLVTAGILPPLETPLSGVPIFTVRGDWDALVAGLTLCWLPWSRWRPEFVLLVFGLAAWGTVAQGSRAGLLGAFAALCVIAIKARVFSRPRLGPIVVIMGCFLSATATATWLIVSGVPSWAAGLDRLIPSSSSEAIRGANTAAARENAWSLIWSWVQLTPERLLFGDGVGSSFVVKSGALPYLSGDVTVRQAHCYVVTWLAEVGVLGLTLICTWLVIMLLRSYRSAGADFTSFGIAQVVGILVTGLAGVVVESPFGYQSLVLGFCISSHALVSANPSTQLNTSKTQRKRVSVRSDRNPP
jgi:O-Antigen ligase